ncbi:hypothetical protein QBC34DRAFT_295718 [Podospora aff. communis PSN243]|uniref:Uncharacterized protein n=1 Tax=Podospora aff. communis PSN243 TaxID=3040156 RepID=A0AAV9GS87_9PEZI|nr:hypothetical protein QBC34DRAFT_295718 [Podospora aff. communis PSN243]
MEGPDPLNSNSSLRVSFDATRKYLFPESRWRCADVAGTYSTEFRSKPAYPTRDEAIGLPLYCVSRICTLDTPFRIEGMLLAPASYLRPKKYTAPEGISNPACLRTSQGIEYWNSPFVITRFLWQATTITEIMYLGQGTGFPRSTRPHNRTLVVALRNSATNLESSCSFSDVALDGETDRWWPCFREAQDPHRRPLQRSVETWIQFSANAGLLRVNQTWYCNSENGEVPYKITGTATLPKTRGTGSAQGLLCGNGTNTFYGLACPQQFFITGDRCDYVYTAQWCTLGDREGYLNYPGIPLNMPIQSIETVRLPVGELTEPEPNPSVWSCTVASLGRGPVKWALQTSGWADLFSLTDWFGWIGHLTPEMNTGFTFDLNSSVFVGFPGTAYSKDGVIRGVGRVSEEDGPFLTPGMRSFDPSRVYTNTPLTDYWAPGWKFYQALGWEVRFDVSTGYMELKHSWYCDDKNVDTPIFPGVRTGDIQREGVMCRLTGGKKELVVVPTVTSFVSSKRIPDQIRQY